MTNCFRGSTSKSYHKSLEEFEWVGTCNVTTTSYAFYSCDEFCKIKGNFEDVTNWQQMFGLAGDIDISELQMPTSGITTSTQAMMSSRIRKITGTAGTTLFSGVRYASSIMESCALLNTVGTSTNPTRWDSLDNAAGFSQAFQTCTNLKQAYFREASTVPLSIYRMFRNCYALGRVETINGSNVTNTTGAFQDCRSLEWLRITGLTVSFDLTNCNMSREGLVQVFNDLGEATATITITNNPGVPDLTTENLLIATDKGWTVTT